MKKLILLLFIGVSLSLQAQDFAIEVADTTLYGKPTSNTFFGDIDLINNKGSKFHMTWERVEESIPEGWTTSNCDPGECHAEGVTTASFDLPTFRSYLNCHFYPHGVAGTGFMKVKLWVTDDPSQSEVLTFYGVAGVTSVPEIRAQDIQVFPTPAHDQLQVLFPGTGTQVNVALFDMLGNQTIQHTLEAGSVHTLNISTLAEGVYMARFSFPGGKTLIKRVVKR